MSVAMATLQDDSVFEEKGEEGDGLKDNGQTVPTLHVLSNCGFDSKIEDELDRINNAISEINRLSGNVFSARMKLKNNVNASKQKLNRIYNVNRKHIEKSRPYYKAQSEAAKIKDEFVQATINYRQACLEFDDAKENASAAEKALMCNTTAVVGLGETDEPDVLINLNKANEKVHTCSQEKSITSDARRKKGVQLAALDTKIQNLHKEAGRRTVDKAASYFELRLAMEKELQIQLQEVREERRHLQEAKDKYRSAFNNLDVISSEIEQRQCAIDVNSTRDLSKFEEIDDLEDILDSNAPPQRARSLDSILSAHSTDSCGSDHSLRALDEHGRPLSRSISLDEVVVHELTSDPWQHDPRELLANYAVSFQMQV